MPSFCRSFAICTSIDRASAGRAKIRPRCATRRTSTSNSPAVRVVVAGQKVAYFGEVHPVVCGNYDIKEKVFVAVIDMPTVAELSNYDFKYKGIAKFPEVNRDLSMLASKSILAGEIEQCIKNNGGEYLEKVELFDVYEGNQIAVGYKSLAYSISFRAKDKTLEEAEITAAMDNIIKSLAKMNVELRQ